MVNIKPRVLVQRRVVVKAIQAVTEPAVRGGRGYTAAFRKATVTEVRRNKPFDPPVAAGVRVVAAGETWTATRPWVQLSAETKTRRTRVDRETGTRTAVTDERAVEDSTSSPCLLFLHKPPVVETPLPVAG